jgi:integrase/recombinase XerD
MKYPLDFEETPDKSLLFWLTRFIRYKVTTLTNRNITDKHELEVILKDLINNIHSIEDLTMKVKLLRKIGMSGTNVYYVPLEKFYHYFIGFGAASLKEIDEELITDFLTSSTSGLSDATKKNYRIALVTFFNYIDKQNQDDLGNIHRYDIELKKWSGLSGKSGIKLPSYMNKEEINKFLAALNSYKFGIKLAARNRLIIKLILYTGIRVSEALKLEMKDMFKEDNIYVFQVKGKGNKPRVAMIKEDIISSDLEDWLSRKPNTNLLFSNQKGKCLSQAYVYTTVENILSEAAINKTKKGPHFLRHTFASMLYQKSKDLILVQEVLGHADINTTRIYTHFDKDKLKGTMDLF